MTTLDGPSTRRHHRPLERARPPAAGQKVVAVLAILSAAACRARCSSLVLGIGAHQGLSQLDISFFTKPKPLFGKRAGSPTQCVGSASSSGCRSSSPCRSRCSSRSTSRSTRARARPRSSARARRPERDPGDRRRHLHLGLLVVGHGQSAIFAALALAILMLPMVARATQEVLVLVPRSLREASLALGVPRWRTVYSIVLPTAIGGILTGVVLAVARVAGETAPILFTSSFARTRSPPTCHNALASCRFRSSRTPSRRRPGRPGGRVGGGAGADRLRARHEHPREDLRRPEAPQARGVPLRGGGASRRNSQRRRRSCSAISPASTNTIATPPVARVSSSMPAPTRPAHGIVISQASTMLPATPQRTAMQAAGRAGTQHGARDRVGRRDGVAVVRGPPEDRRARRLGREALRRVDLRDPLPSVLMMRQPPA